ncbi:MAG: RnfABCDGE type electron transport complex subunit C, partial [Chitinivibrionales bacterium]|nr:RnfABCDGE type electron transport complex subunit C [Chitinivibrionales bacterium]
GMGGGGCPTHLKISPPSAKKINTLVINGVECEPYYAADYRLLIEKTDELLMGALILKKAVGSDVVYIAITQDNQEAVSAITKKIAANKYKNISVVKTVNKYPMSGEKQLLAAITKHEIPSGGQPLDIGCLVHNVATAYAVWDAVYNGKPLYERVVTVAGPAIKKPANLLVRIGTPIRHILSYCAIECSKTKKIIMGGSMSGVTVPDTAAPVIKSTRCIQALTHTHEAIAACTCISCGRCNRVCPIHLVPSMIVKFVEKACYFDAYQLHIMDCIECGCCSYSCPAKINLVHFLQLGKFHCAATVTKKESE